MQPTTFPKGLSRTFGLALSTSSRSTIVIGGNMLLFHNCVHTYIQYTVKLARNNIFHITLLRNLSDRAKIDCEYIL